jgi:hypothetical protein
MRIECISSRGEFLLRCDERIAIKAIELARVLEHRSSPRVRTFSRIGTHDGFRFGEPNAFSREQFPRISRFDDPDHAITSRSCSAGIPRCLARRLPSGAG